MYNRRSGKWEYFDKAERVAVFSKACIQLARDINFKPDIIRSNDWQTALVAPYLKITDTDYFFKNTAALFSIHNIGFQGVFQRQALPFIGIGEHNFVEDKFENFGGINFVKSAIFYADSITTVSKSYSEEIMTPVGGNGWCRS